jgi:hypothetical protein
MIHRTHKRFVRELPMDVALQVANRLAAATVDFVLETKPATRSSAAYISCHFEETLEHAVQVVSPLHAKNNDLAIARLRVALDPETPDER